MATLASRLVPVGLVLFVAAFALFVAAAAPGLYLRDAGELSTAAYTLGVAHETGFALWCLLAKAATLLPLGEVATRVTLLSAVGGATAVWLVYRAVRSLAPDDPAAVAAGVGAAGLASCGLTFFRASTVPEVYAPTAAALVLALLLLVRAAGGERRAGILLAFLGGLSLGLHAHLRILVGPAAAVVALWRLRRGDRWPLVAPAAVALGAAVIAYLPLRASRDPAANWSDPQTLSALWSHLSATRIRHAYAHEMFHHVGTHLVAFARLAEGQLGLMALLFAAGGLAWLLRARARRPLGLVLLVVLVGDALYSASLNPMAIEDLQNGHPTALVVAIAAGAGVLAAARRLGRAAPWAAAAMGVLLCTPAALADADAKLGLGPEALSWSRAALAQAAPRARADVSSDDLAAGTSYEQFVAGERPDVTILVRQHLWDKKEVAGRLRRSGLDDALKSPSLWESDYDDPIDQLQPDVPLYRVTPAPTLPPVRPLAERIEALLQPGRDPDARRLATQQLTALGRVYLARGDAARAAALFEAALALRPGDVVATIDLAVVRARAGDVPNALRLVDAALEREPHRVIARVNAGRYRLQLGDLDGAERDFTAAHADDADLVAPLVGLARVAEARHDRARALTLLHAAQRLQRDDADVRSLAKELDR
ncbi:MAG: hypothetical protein JWN44_1356 [Myxococcales bacterium]|nr:hypothetical protein [Myxococcales bacterium]